MVVHIFIFYFQNAKHSVIMQRHSYIFKHPNRGNFIFSISRIHLTPSLSLSFQSSFSSPLPPDVIRSDHTRKIELIRYLMSGYVHGQVLDTLSEHANALASTAVASLEEGADELSHFPFLPVPNSPVLRVPKHDGWYRASKAQSSLDG